MASSNKILIYFKILKILFICLLICDINMTTENTHLNDLLQIYYLTALIKEPTCYQSENPLFKHCQTFETGLSDHHKLIWTIMKSGIFKEPLKKRFISFITNLTTNVSVML